MKRNLVLMCLAVLLLAAPSFAAGDSSKTFIMGVGSVLAAQDQEVEDVASTFQLDVIRLVPWTPWWIGAMVQYSRVQTAGEDEIDWNGRLIAFSNDPNAPERDGDWVAFLTLGGVDIHDNDEEENGSRLIPTSADGSVGVIGPVLGFNLVVELGAMRMPNADGKMETYWKFGVGFLGVPGL